MFAIGGSALDIGIVTADEASALDFYEGTLGLEYHRRLEMPGGGRMHSLACGVSMVKLIVPGRQPLHSRSGAPALFRETGIAYWTMWVSDLAALVDRCSAAKVPIVVPMAEYSAGLTIAIVADPDGNLVELAHGVNVARSVEEDGAAAR